MTAWVALFDKGGLGEGARFLVHGCNSAVGSSAVQMAAHFGMRVSGVCGGMPGLDIAPLMGRFISYRDFDETVLPEKFDLVFDTVGSLSVRTGLKLLLPEGRFVDINPTISRIVRGLASRRYATAFASAGIRHLPAIAALAETAVLRPTIGLSLPFGEAPAAIRRAEEGDRPSGRVVVTMEE